MTSVGDDYVDLSKTDCDTGSTVPQAGDEIVGIGNRTNKSRQSAIIISAYGDGSPSIRYYQGIDSYSLTGKAVKEDYYDLSTGRFKTVTYGDSYVGDREGNTFMKYDQENGVEVKGKVSMSSGSTGWENLEGLSGVIKDVSDAASAAQNAADNAQDAADNAQADAESANNRLDQWAEDGVISPTEKLSLKQELENLQSEYDTNIQNAQKYGIDTSAYTSAWAEYKQELEYHSQDTPENITIKETFATSRSSFYKSREDLLVSIANAAKEYADKLVSSISVGAENLLLNTGFTGNYDPKVLSASTPLNKRTYMYSNRLENWSGAGTVNEDESSESGYSCSIGSISQSVSLIEGERYVISYKAKGSSVTVSIGSNTWTDSLSSSYSVYSHKFEYSSGSVFAMAGSADVCEIKLERGTIPTDWCPSRKDTNEVADMFKQYWYLKDAMNGSTDVIGGLVLTSMMQLGKWTDGVMEKVNAGISGIYNEDTDVAFWAGGTFEQAIATVRKIIGGENPSDEEWKSLAKFVATHGGDIFLRGYIYALGGVFRGTVYAENGEFSGIVKAQSLYIRPYFVLGGGFELDPVTMGNFIYGAFPMPTAGRENDPIILPQSDSWEGLVIHVSTLIMTRSQIDIRLDAGTNRFSGIQGGEDEYRYMQCPSGNVFTLTLIGGKWLVSPSLSAMYSNDIESDVWDDYLTIEENSKAGLTTAVTVRTGDTTQSTLGFEKGLLRSVVNSAIQAN